MSKPTQELMKRLGKIVEEEEKNRDKYSALVQKLKEFADKGNYAAISTLGDIYQFGLHGEEQDLDKAEEYHRLAVDNGYYKSAYSLGVMYLLTTVKEKNSMEEGLKYLRLAEANGVAGAQFILGSLHIKGRFVEKDVDRGTALLQAAADQGFKDAVDELKRLKNEETPPVPEKNDAEELD